MKLLSTVQNLVPYFFIRLLIFGVPGQLVESHLECSEPNIVFRAFRYDLIVGTSRSIKTGTTFGNSRVTLDCMIKN